MFYRRKILLALLEAFDNKLSKIELQKYLFLTTISQREPVYEFVPYKYGSYSFTAWSDIGALCCKGFIKIDENDIVKINNVNYIKELFFEDRDMIKKVKQKSAEFKNSRALMHYVYTYAPYYALNSTVKENYLSVQEIENIENIRPHKSGKALCTIGYEGISIEAYINKLIKNDIRCLVDVRRNPRSMKFGFAKSRLEHICNETGIVYISIPELGIDSEERKDIDSDKSYKLLFNNYTMITLKNTEEQQQKVIDLLKKHKRIALTCFEADINRCHRKILADYIQNKYNPVEKIIHL
jgi:uncharacterized protein (DUF488 family)